MGDIAIRVEGLGKSYLIGHEVQRERYTALRDVMVSGVRRMAAGLRDRLTMKPVASGQTTEEFWALKDVNFEIGHGDVVGIVGRNGAGKSTLLKILSRITEPTRGRVTIDGRVASLLEVGTGFHPELTGRENIHLNGAILGMSRAEIRRKFDEIVDFAEVEKFLDTPVKRYSSGMYVRLAFAVAAHLEPDILVVDEVLAVGDAEFQKKCLGKMKDVAGRGRTVLFVSHNTGAIQSLCNSCVFLKSGMLSGYSDTKSILARYAAEASSGAVFVATKAADSSISVVSAEASPLQMPDGSVRLDLRLRLQSMKRQKISIDVRLRDAMGAAIGFSSLGALDSSGLIEFDSGMFEVGMSTALGDIAEGVYSASIDLTVPNSHFIERLEDCLSVQIHRLPVEQGRRCHEYSWGLGAMYFPAILTRKAVLTDVSGN